MYTIDLHTHTQASDGSDTPADVVIKAASKGIETLAITDHDTVSGLNEAVAQGRSSGVEVVRGCELSAHSPYGEVHILGLWLPEKVHELEQILAQLRAHRGERNKVIVSRLQAIGLQISYDEVLEAAAGETVGRPHIASVLVQKSYVSSVAEAFATYLGTKGKAFVPKKILSLEEAVQALARLGATVSLAHPGLLRCPPAWLQECIDTLIPLGLTAIEAYHSDHDVLTQQYYMGLAASKNMLLTGGSDYHGTNKPHIHLGVGRGNLRIPTQLVEDIKKARRAQGLPV